MEEWMLVGCEARLSYRVYASFMERISSSWGSCSPLMSKVFSCISCSIRIIKSHHSSHLQFPNSIPSSHSPKEGEQVNDSTNVIKRQGLVVHPLPQVRGVRMTSHSV